MQVLLVIFVGAGLGGLLRHFTNQMCQRWFGTDLPWGVFIINVSGSFLMGVATGVLAFKATAAWPHSLRLFMTTGVLGGYTTFSAFSLDAVVLIERGDFMEAGLFIAGSVVLSIASLLLGLGLVRSLT
jgi:CrcB protein